MFLRFCSIIISAKKLFTFETIFIIVVCISHICIGPLIVDNSVVSNLTECPDFVHLTLSYKVGTVCIIAHHFTIAVTIKVHSCSNAGNLVSTIYLCINECDTILNGTVDSTVTRSGNDYDISTYFVVHDTSIDEIWNATFILKHDNKFDSVMTHFEVDGELVYHTKHYTLTSLPSLTLPSVPFLSPPPLPSPPLSLRCGYQYTGMQHISFTLHHHYHQ